MTDSALAHLNAAIDGLTKLRDEMLFAAEEKPDPRLRWEGAKDHNGSAPLLVRSDSGDRAFMACVSTRGAHLDPPRLYAFALAAVRFGMALEGIEPPAPRLTQREPHHASVRLGDLRSAEAYLSLIAGQDA